MNPTVWKTTALKYGIEVGTKFQRDPANYGAIGLQVEIMMAEHGYMMNPGQGADLPDLKVEVKTRDVESDSAYTIGTMSVENIIKYSWPECSLKSKTHTVYMVEHIKTPVDYGNTEEMRAIGCFEETKPIVDNTVVVTDAYLLDLSYKDCQSLLEIAYEKARQKIIQGDRSRYIKGSDYGQLELQVNGNYQFRISNAAMKSFKILSSQAQAVDALIEGDIELDHSKRHEEHLAKVAKTEAEKASSATQKSILNSLFQE